MAVFDIITKMAKQVNGENVSKGLKVTVNVANHLASPLQNAEGRKAVIDAFKQIGIDAEKANILSNVWLEITKK